MSPHKEDYIERTTFIKVLANIGDSYFGNLLQFKEEIGYSRQYLLDIIP